MTSSKRENDLARVIRLKFFHLQPTFENKSTCLAKSWILDMGVRGAAIWCREKNQELSVPEGARLCLQLKVRPSAHV